MMDLIITEQSRSVRAYRASNGASPLAAGQVSEISLTELLDWFRAKDNLALNTSTDEIFISQYNQAGIEILRTTISCDESDREELISALQGMTAAAF